MYFEKRGHPEGCPNSKMSAKTNFPRKTVTRHLPGGDDRETFQASARGGDPSIHRTRVHDFLFPTGIVPTHTSVSA